MGENAPGTPEWLRDDLGAQLSARLPGIRKLENYYDGKHKLAFATSRFRETFGNLFGAFADNWCPIVVDASVERLQVVGFRFGDSPDKDAARMWQANKLDAASMLAHTEAVKLGVSYVMVTPRGRGQVPRITVEHPSQVIVQHDEGDRTHRTAALKRWSDRAGYWYATLYTPTHVFKWQTEEPVRGDESTVTWVPRKRANYITRNPLGVVPVIPLYNNPGMIGPSALGRSDLATVLPLQDMVNKLVMDMIVAAEFAAFRQRWATGIEIPEDEDGKPTRESKFLASLANVWTVEDEQAKFGEFGVTDLDNYVKGINLGIQHLAAQTRTPMHYLLADMVNISGDALKAAETGLTSKVKRKWLPLGEGWEESMRLGFRAMGDTAKAEAEDAETMWADPETRSRAEKADALVKARDIGIPEEILWEEYGLTPKQMERAKAARAEQLLQMAMLGVVAPGDNGMNGGGSPAAHKGIPGNDPASRAR